MHIHHDQHDDDHDDDSKHRGSNHPWTGHGTTSERAHPGPACAIEQFLQGSTLRGYIALASLSAITGRSIPSRSAAREGIESDTTAA